MSASTNYFVYSKLWSLFEFLCHSSTCIWLWHFFQKGRILLIHNHYIHWIRVICYDVYMTDFRFLVLVVSYGITMILRISGRYSQEFYLWTKGQLCKIHMITSLPMESEGSHRTIVQLCPKILNNLQLIVINFWLARCVCNSFYLFV
jgi:hypothetical protein